MTRGLFGQKNSLDLWFSARKNRLDTIPVLILIIGGEGLIVKAGTHEQV